MDTCHGQTIGATILLSIGKFVTGRASEMFFNHEDQAGFIKDIVGYI